MILGPYACTLSHGEPDHLQATSDMSSSRHLHRHEAAGQDREATPGERINIERDGRSG